jgi:hypothetical protein
MGSEGVAGTFVTGEPCAKNRILIAMARPACRTTTTISKMRDGFASMAETTGYLCIRRLVLIPRAMVRRAAGLNVQVSEEENSGHGQTDADEGVVERCDMGQNTIPVAIESKQP